MRLRDRTIDLPLERYVAAVLAGESSVFQSAEALKAMAVAARTYAVRFRGRHASEGFDLCATPHCQRIDLDAIRPRLESIGAETAGEMLWYQGKPAFACYSRDCAGRAEDAAEVWPDHAAPYLKSHGDPYCVRAGPSSWQWSISAGQLADLLRRSEFRAPRNLQTVAILERTAAGRARTLALNGPGETARMSAGSLRFAVGRELGFSSIQSDRYEIRILNGRIAFEGSGSGHGVGLCQKGADRMGTEGRTYREILAFYYPGTAVGLTGRGLSWHRLGGERISLMTTQPDLDRPLLALAENSLRDLPAPGGIELRVYPDLDTFRNATGEPGWVAAHTQGRRIHLQPVSVLRQKGALERTIRHELFHVSIESQAAPGLPLWFREGLAGFLEQREGPAAPIRIPPDTDLRQTSDPARARRAYADAVRAVRGLVNRYGLAAAFEWLKAGLPPHVTNASASHDATKSK